MENCNIGCSDRIVYGKDKKLNKKNVKFIVDKLR